MKRKIWISAAVLALLLSGSVLAQGQYKTIEVFFETFSLKINGQASSKPVEGLVYNGTIYLPVRSVGETMNAQVTWSNDDRSINIDFVRSDGDPVIQAADNSAYQYIAVEKNQIMERLIDSIRKSDDQGMKSQLSSLQQLEEMAGNMGDSRLKELFNRMVFSGEVIRSGLAKKNAKDYKLAARLFADAESAVTSHLLSKLSAASK